MPHIPSAGCSGRLRSAIASVALLSAAAYPGGPVEAQAPPQLPPPSGAVAPLITTPLPRVLPSETPQIVPPAQPPVEAPAPPPPGPPVRVDQVRIEGVTVYNEETLRALYGGVVGATVPRARLDEIAQALQARYREDGYILTLVRGEARREGSQLVFVIQATEGYISDVKLEGDIGPAGTLVLEMLEHLTGRHPVNNADLERYLLLANDIPGVKARAILRRAEGTQPGAVLLVAQVDRKPVSGLLTFDNRAPRFAGPYEMLLGGATNSFTRFGENAEALFYNTFNREQIFGQINLSGYVNSEGLKLRTYYGQGSSLPGDILALSNFQGDLRIGGAALVYPFIRSRRFNVFSDVAIDSYNSTTTVGTVAQQQTGSNLWIGRIGTGVDYQDGWFFDRFAANALNVRLSQGMIGTSSERPGNDPHFIKVSGDLTRVQDLFWIGTVRTALKTSVGGQYTNDILPPAEKFFLGGTRFGRGYFYGEVTGDRAIGSTVELQFNTEFTQLPWVNPAYRLPVQFYAFWDYGRGINVPSTDPNHTIQSLGIGTRSDITPWLFWEVEGVHRLVTHPQGTQGIRALNSYAAFTRLTLHY